MSFWKRSLLVLILVMFAAGTRVRAQQEASAPQEHPNAADSGEEPDEPAKPAPIASETTATIALEQAWAMLQDGVASQKVQMRIDAVSAVGTLGVAGKSRALLEKAMKDKERDVRLAAVTAMGASGNRTVLPMLQDALDNDAAPEVAYAAAVALWKMHDHSGEDVLYGVLLGNLKPGQGVVGSQMHQASRTLHDPAALARIGAEQGAYALLGPFGIGLDAARMLYKGHNPNSARVLSASLLAQDKSLATARAFITALDDKDYFVRTASARALGEYHGSEVTAGLMKAFGDNKPAVRFMAAASYIRASGQHAPAKRAKTRKP